MPELRWNEVDDYISQKLVGDDDALEAALTESTKAGLPAIAVSPPQGKFLAMLARVHGATKILEIGTLGGYSTIWMARALPAGGRVITLEYDAKHAEVARKNLARAGVADRVEVRVGAALDLLPKIEAEKFAPFDLFFIDADKANNANYVAWSLKLSRPGSVIVVDNVVRDGSILDASSTDAAIRGVRDMYDLFANEKRLDATAIQTVGSKGWDGFALAIVR